MKTLLERLRTEHSHGLSDDAADEIERLQRELLDHMWWERTAVELQRQRDSYAAERDRLRAALELIGGTDLLSVVGIDGKETIAARQAWAKAAAIAREALGPAQETSDPADGIPELL